MKFKYIGKTPIGCIDFVMAGLIAPGASLEPDMVYDVPDDDIMFISMCESSPLFEKEEPKKKKAKGDK